MKSAVLNRFRSGRSEKRIHTSFHADQIEDEDDLGTGVRTLTIGERELPVLSERTFYAGLDPLFSILELGEPRRVDLAI